MRDMEQSEIIDGIVNRVVNELKKRAPEIVVKKHLKGCFNTIDEAIEASEKAFREFRKVSIGVRKKIIERIRKECREKVDVLSKMAVDETSLGRVEDKIKKNILAIEKTPGIEDLFTESFTGDYGLTLIERSPYGIIGSITPCTNPTETIICNGIGMIAGGNVVVFNAHPAAKKISAYTIDLLNNAVIAEGGPENLFTTVLEPTIESASQLMKHERINLLVVTGGPNVVDAVMKSGKKVIAAGPGNPPVVVDETTRPDKVAKDIIFSSSIDNNIICVSEKEIIATENCADNLKRALVEHGALLLNHYHIRELEALVVDGDHPNKKWVGKNVQNILKEIGIKADESKRLAIAETEPYHSFAKIELLMPILPLITVRDFDEALEVALKLENKRFHSSVIHSKNIDRMHEMHIKMNTTIFVKNGMALSGLGFMGEGPASFTIATSTGEGVTTAMHFTRSRHCVMSEKFGIA